MRTCFVGGLESCYNGLIGILYPEGANASGYEGSIGVHVASLPKRLRALSLLGRDSAIEQQRQSVFVLLPGLMLQNESLRAERLLHGATTQQNSRRETRSSWRLPRDSDLKSQWPVILGYCQ